MWLEPLAEECGLYDAYDKLHKLIDLRSLSEFVYLLANPGLLGPLSHERC